MKRLILIITFILIPCLSFAGILEVIARKRIAAGGTCETVVYTNTGSTAGDWDVKDNTDFTYIGERVTESVTYSPCEIDFYLTWKAGDISSYDYYVVINTVDGSGNFDTLIATSETVTGSNAWSDEPITFTFASPPSLTGSTAYCFSVTHGSTASATNYAEAEYDSGEITGNAMLRHNGAGAIQETVDSIAFRMVIREE